MGCNDPHTRATVFMCIPFIDDIILDRAAAASAIQEREQLSRRDTESNNHVGYAENKPGSLAWKL